MVGLITSKANTAADTSYFSDRQIQWERDTKRQNESIIELLHNHSTTQSAELQQLSEPATRVGEVTSRDVMSITSIVNDTRDSEPGIIHPPAHAPFPPMILPLLEAGDFLSPNEPSDSPTRWPWEFPDHLQLQLQGPYQRCRSREGSIFSFCSDTRNTTASSMLNGYCESEISAVACRALPFWGDVDREKSMILEKPESDDGLDTPELQELFSDCSSQSDEFSDYKLHANLRLFSYF